MSFHRIKKRNGRHGFTLVELLMSISIITILATLAIAVLRGAEDDARAARTATVVGNIRTVIQRRMEDYETRTIPFRFADIGVVAMPQMQAIRNRLLAEWFRAEMPTRFSDLEQFPSAQSLGNADPAVAAMAQRMLFRPPARVRKLRSALFFFGPDSMGAATHSNDPTFEDAECLYAILNNSTDGGRRGTHFLTPSEIGDKDGDGLPEVLDGWGDPLSFRVFVSGAPINPDAAGEFNDYQIAIESVRSQL